MPPNLNDTVAVLYCKTSYGEFQNYVYFIVDKPSQKAVVVDPVWEIDKIYGVLESHELTLDAVLLTHAHEDHTDLAHEIHQQMGVALYMHEEEIGYYQYSCRGLESFSSTDTFLLGDQTWIEPLWTPGHTVGSACYYTGNALFTGDTLFIEGCGLCDEPGGSAEALYQSLQKIKTVCTPTTRIYPAHGYGKPIGMALKHVLDHNIYMHFQQQAEFVKFRMRPNQVNLYDFK